MMQKDEAQRRSDRIRAFNEELETLAAEGILVLGEEEQLRVTVHHAGPLAADALRPHYRVRLASGQRYEPWVVAIEPLAAEALQ